MRDANHNAPPAVMIPTTIDSHTCHIGGGAVDVRRSSMANAFIGGMKLTIVANSEFGSREIGNQNSHGIIISSVIGVINGCASRSSFTDDPIAAINDPMVTYVIRKKINRYTSSIGSTRPSIAIDTRLRTPIEE